MATQPGGLTLQQLQAKGAQPAQPQGLTLEQIVTQQHAQTQAQTQPKAEAGFAGTKFIGQQLGTIAEGGNLAASEKSGNDLKNLLNTRVASGQTTPERAAQLSKGLTPDMSALAPKFENKGDLVRSGVKAGTDIASLAMPVGESVNAVANTVKGTIGKAFVSGFKSTAIQGATQGFGEGIEQNKGIGNTIAQTGKQALVQGLFGGATEATLAGLSKAISGNKPADVDQFIKDKFQKGVKPSMAGKTKTAGQYDAYQDKAVEGVKSIVNNKENLKIVDQYGEETGKLPESLKEFVQGIDQTKRSFFEKYDAMAKQAGEQGAQVDLLPIANELEKIKDNPVMQDLHPEVVQYALGRAEALKGRGAYDAETAQEAIQTLNKSLEAYYRNPTYDTASKAAVDSMVANQMRKGLDDAIENTSGAGYQELKNQYGALKSIEGDVVKRALVDARKNTKGFFDIGDVFSAGDIVHGLATMNPAGLASGLAKKGVTEYLKFLNNPNRAIKQLFQGADKAMNSGVSKVGEALLKPVDLGEAAGNISAKIPLGLSIKDISKLKGENADIAMAISDHLGDIPENEANDAMTLHGYMDKLMKNQSLTPKEKATAQTILKGANPDFAGFGAPEQPKFTVSKIKSNYNQDLKTGRMAGRKSAQSPAKI